MADFHVGAKKYDGAYCTVDTFRHLLSEKEAEQHLINVSKALKKNGLYILGLHLFPERDFINKVTRWTARRGCLTVNTSMTMLDLNKKKRTETLKVVLNQRTKTQNSNYESIYKLRTYSLKQFNKLLSSVNVFEIINAYDHYYDLSSPIMLDKASDYAVFVLRKV